MKVDFFLIENDRKTSIYHDEFRLGRILVMPKTTLQLMSRRTKRRKETSGKSYDTVVHISSGGQRYAVAFSGEAIPAFETDELIRKSVPKPTPLA
ncbi:hypothetical protein [Sodalis sp. C49]|uniref:hypothetical protein n=1 Tax=unclassified Sodalis (in: enterobacteria) TaxID=2636512 RepID=UPI003965A76D